MTSVLGSLKTARSKMLYAERWLEEVENRADKNVMTKCIIGDVEEQRMTLNRAIVGISRIISRVEAADERERLAALFKGGRSK